MPFVARYLLAECKSNSALDESAVLLLNWKVTLLSYFYSHKQNTFDKLPVLIQETLYYVGPISGQISSFATEAPCEDSPSYLIELDFVAKGNIHKDEH